MRFLLYCFLVSMLACKATSVPYSSINSSIDFKSWHTTVMDTFERKTGFSKGVEGKSFTSFSNVFNTLASFSEENLYVLFEKAETKKNDWDKLFIVDLFVQGESPYEVTAVLLYKKSKYRGFSYDDKNFLPIKYISKFKVWKIRPSIEYFNDGYVVISEFDKSYRNVQNLMYIGTPNTEINEQLLKIYDDKVFD